MASGIPPRWYNPATSAYLALHLLHGLRQQSWRQTLEQPRSFESASLSPPFHFTSLSIREPDEIPTSYDL